VKASSRIPELDGLRGLACLLVVSWHYFGATTQVTPSTLAASIRAIAGPWGLSGVDLFFVLSGFLIGGILQDHRESPRYYRTFYTRRVCRIFPVYYSVIAALLLVLTFSLQKHFPGMSEWLLKDLMPIASYLTFTQNFWMAAAIVSNGGGRWLAMTWSVAVEEQFYLLFPMVARNVTIRSLPVVMVSVIVVAPLLRGIVDAHGWWSYALLPCRFDCLGVGVLAACLVRRRQAREYLTGNRSSLYCGMLLCLCGLKFLNQPLGLHYTWLALFYGCVLLIVVLHPQSSAAALCRNRGLRALGLISYVVYMYHQMFNGLVFAIVRGHSPVLAGWADFELLLLALALTLGVATLSYLVLEKPILALGHRAEW
jgi:peptidoglycan/LPS O-acetylase OafA/YrhL